MAPGPSKGKLGPGIGLPAAPLSASVTLGSNVAGPVNGPTMGSGSVIPAAAPRRTHEQNRRVLTRSPPIVPQLALLKQDLLRQTETPQPAELRCIRPWLQRPALAWCWCSPPSDRKS